MNNCINCNTANADEAVFCKSCGAQLSQAGAPVAQQSTFTEAPQQQSYAQPTTQASYTQPVQNQYNYPNANSNYGATQNTTGMLIFSIINTVLCLCCSIGGVLGIIALIFTIQAKKALTPEEFNSKMKTVKILNIIGAVLAALWIIVYLILFAIGFVEGFTESYYGGYNYYY